MNFSLLDKIDSVRTGILATILRTEGHTYKKRGARTFFAAGAHAPLWGNLGSVCVDQELVRQGGEAMEEGKPRTVRIDTSEVEDADFGYGTYCGGVMEVLIEPVFDSHKHAFRELRARLEAGQESWLVHDLDSGKLDVRGERPSPDDRSFAERITPPLPLFLFGATPLVRRLVTVLSDMDYRLHVADWRQDYLERFSGLDGVMTHFEQLPIDADSWVLIMSHHFHRDKAALEASLKRGCTFVGMLSSRTRRDRMFEELRRDGVPQADLDRVASPIGLDVGARSDGEIALAIAAQLVERRRR